VLYLNQKPVYKALNLKYREISIMKHQDPIDPITGKYSFLVDPAESIIYELNRGMFDKVKRFVSGNTSLDEREIITNKRLYYYKKNSSVFDNSEVITTLDLADITATELAAYNRPGMLVLSIVALLGGILILIGSFSAYEMAIVLTLGLVLLGIGIGLLVAFFKARTRWFVVHYAGGSLKFCLKRYSMETVKSFQRELYHQKSLVE
jgi:hypothetical protein